jgi:hypothetical protein
MSLSIFVPLAAVGVLVAVAAFLVLRDPGSWNRRVEALFRKPPRPPKPPDQNHYYRPYWS